MSCKHGPGYTRCYMRSKYGSRAFDSRGLLKVSVLREEKAKLKRNPRHSKYTMRAITEAINFEHKRA